MGQKKKKSKTEKKRKKFPGEGAEKGGEEATSGKEINSLHIWHVGGILASRKGVWGLKMKTAYRKRISS